jgi:hypothetical protein
MGCVPSHGGVALYGDDILAATGGNIILEIDRAGRIRRGFDTQQKRTHLMEFLVDDRVNRLFALGPCDYVSGFSVIDLTTSGRPVVREADGLKLESTPSEAPVASTTLGPCGDRVAFGMNSLVAIGRRGGLDILDVRTGKVLQTINTPSSPIDVLVTPYHNLVNTVRTN